MRFAGRSALTSSYQTGTVGVLIGVVSALVAFAWLPYSPVWAIIFIAGAVAIIWSLIAHGRDITEIYAEA